MLNIFSDEEYVEAINAISNTRFNGPTSWNEIMLTIHRVILSVCAILVREIEIF